MSGDGRRRRVRANDEEDDDDDARGSPAYGRWKTSNNGDGDGGLPSAESNAERAKGLLSRFQTHQRAVALQKRNERGYLNTSGGRDADTASMASSETRSNATLSERDFATSEDWKIPTRMPGRDRFGATAAKAKSVATMKQLQAKHARRGGGNQFNVVENARLALEAKDAQLQKMAARLAELERAKDEEQIGRARGEMREFQAQATDLEGEMKEAMRRLRGGGDAGSVEDDAGVQKSAPAAFSARDDSDASVSEDRGGGDAGPIREEGNEDDAMAMAMATPPPIPPGKKVEGGVLTPSGRVVGSALKPASTPASRRKSAAEALDTPGIARRNVMFHAEEEYSDAGVQVDAKELAELRNELREVRVALKSAFGVSEKLVEQCEKKNAELKEKSTVIKLAREEVEKSRKDLKKAMSAKKDLERRVEELERRDGSAAVTDGGDASLRNHLVRLSQTVEKSKRSHAGLMDVIKSAIGVNAELSPDVVFTVLPILSSLAVRGDMANALVSGGALDGLSNVLEIFADDASICCRALEAIESICRLGADSSVVVHDAEIIELRSAMTDQAIQACGAAVCRSVADHLEDAAVCETACSVALAFAEFGDYKNIQFLVRRCDVVSALVEASKAHGSDEDVQRASSCAIAAFASCDEETKNIIESSGAMSRLKRCVHDLGLDDAVRLFPNVKRWISSSKKKSRNHPGDDDVVRPSDDATAAETGGGNTGISDATPRRRTPDIFMNL